MENAVSKEPQFKAEEVWAVAKALLENSVSHDVSSSGGRNSYNECNHCKGRVQWTESDEQIAHESHCAVLVARDLLAGAPPEVLAA